MRTPGAMPGECNGPLAQSVEQKTFNLLVDGSNPSRPTNCFNNLGARWAPFLCFRKIAGKIRWFHAQLRSFPWRLNRRALMVITLAHRLGHVADAADQAPAPASTQAFTFGEATPVLDSRGILDYAECWQNGRYYEPPVSLSGLARTTRSNPTLQSGLLFKRNMLSLTFKPHPLLSRERFNQLAPRGGAR